jgi:hypothetical protein
LYATRYIYTYKWQRRARDPTTQPGPGKIASPMHPIHDKKDQVFLDTPCHAKSLHFPFFCICTIPPPLSTSNTCACFFSNQALIHRSMTISPLRDNLTNIDHLRFPGLLGLDFGQFHVAGKHNVVRSRRVKIPAPERSSGGAHASFVQTTTGSFT